MNIATVSRAWATAPAPQTEPAWLQGTGEKPADIVNGFNPSERRFGEQFDCSTHAAVIKMMMMTFGKSPADMFERIEPNRDGYEITMKDEFKVKVSHLELQQAARGSRFTGHDAALVESANFVFAAFVKRKQNTDGYSSFDTALVNSLQGETTLRALKGMGVYGMSRYVPSSEMVGKDAVGVLATHNFGSRLVLDGIAHNYGARGKIDHRYGYKLFSDPSPGHRRRETRAPHSPSTLPADIWSGFYQGIQSNCVTVSAIKAAMMRFGQRPEDIYKQVTVTAQGYDVTMRDGFSLHLTYSELLRAQRGSNFHGADQALLSHANFLYAVSAKRAQRENNDFRGAQSFEVAMETLNDGEYPGQALRRLGLYGYVRETDVRELASGAIGTLADHGHSVVVINGVVDYYGQKQDLVSSRWMNTGYRALKLV